MTPSPSAARSLDEALAQALEDLEAGLPPLQIVDRFPQYEADIAPLIETAYRLRTARWPVLSMTARVVGRERMHAALAEQKARRRVLVPPLWRQLGAGVALALLAGTTYLASPMSPIHRASGPRPAIMIPMAASATPTATWTVQAPPTLEPSPTNTTVASPTHTATRLSPRTVEPTEEVNRLTDLWHAPSPTPTATSTKPVRMPTSTPTATAPATSKPEENRQSPPTQTATAEVREPHPPKASATPVAPEPGRAPKPSRTRHPEQTTEPTQTSAAASASSEVTVVKAKIAQPGPSNANGLGPTHERRDEMKERPKVEPPRGKDRKR